MRRRYWCNSHNEFDRDYDPSLPLYKQHCDVHDFKARGRILLPCDVVDLEEVGLEIYEDGEEQYSPPDHRGDD